MKIGVALTLHADAAETIADARALEAAGVDSLWILGADADPWVLGAAVAAATWRARLVLAGTEERETARATLERIARGRLVAATQHGEELALAAGSGEPERWRLRQFPAGRAEWKRILADAEASGLAGVVLPNDPRVLDLIRNPDVEEDRSDIKLAFG
ncbi:MAG TPA: hypothetical protein VIA63_02305 [Candidatus Limnocylindria bacterium]